MRSIETKLKQLEKTVNLEYLNECITVYLETDDNETLKVGMMHSNGAYKYKHIKTATDFDKHFKGQKVELIFIDDITANPVPGSLADKALNGGLSHFNYDLAIQRDYR